MNIIAIDPGLRGCGYAFFQDATLFNVAYIANPEERSGNISADSNHMASALCCADGTTAGRLVIELPRVYQGGRQKGDPDDLIMLSLLVGRVIDRLNLPTTIYRPHEWKGNVPKEVMGARIWAHLTAAERALVLAVKPAYLRHNAIDAVGIGLKFLERL